MDSENSERKSIEVQVPNIAVEKLGYFRYGRIDDRVILTNDAGEWVLLTSEEFEGFLVGDIEAGHPKYVEFSSKGFVRSNFDLDDMANKVRRKKAFLNQGPHLHIVITTLRCNQSCKYCHASRTDMDRVDTDMSLDTAKLVVDTAMQSPSPYICFEYTGGEPTINMEAMRFMVSYSKEKNRYEKKRVEHSVVTNMTYMNEENAQFLIDNDIWVCTSLDGPSEVHNWNRTWQKGSGAYENVLKWIGYFNQKYIEKGLDPDLYHVDALMTTTRKTFDHWKELVDLYVELGIKNIHIRPLNPFGFANKTWRVIGYTMEEYLDFYSRVLDYIMELNMQGIQIMEGTAALFLKKILTPEDPNFVDIRSPIGSGTGQLAFNYDGKVYPSDEGRMVAAMGDDYFLLGKVGENSYEELAHHPTVKTLALSSILDSLPQCHNCWNAPYCGVRPLHNYMKDKDIFGQRPNSLKCKEHMHISKVLFSKLQDPQNSEESAKIEHIFRRWIVSRPRE
jgi:uncharacterized protein